MELFWGLFILGFVVVFAVAETYAIRTNRATLSRTVWEATQNFPLLPFIVGLIFGGLGVHFFWTCEGCPIN